MQGPARLTAQHSRAEPTRKQPSAAERLPTLSCLRCWEVSCAGQITWPSFTETTEHHSQPPTSPGAVNIKLISSQGCSLVGGAEPPLALRCPSANWKKAPLTLGSETPHAPLPSGQAPCAHVCTCPCFPANCVLSSSTFGSAV